MGKASFGGSKGAAILEALKAGGAEGVTRAEIAEKVGCTPQRVGEVFRAHGGYEQVEGSKRYRLTGDAPARQAAKPVAEKRSHKKKADAE